jgi:hypothetical protein
MENATNNRAKMIIHFDHETGEDFEIVRDPNVGGWLQGRIAVPYSDLVSAFGSPTHHGSGDGKVQCEWSLRINGVMATIYDWKEDRQPQAVRDWHIGGTDKDAVEMVRGSLAAWRNSLK